MAESDPAPEHWLTLEVRRVSGIENGVRADWSTYVDDGAGVRTLVLESRASFAALDPVNRFTDPYPVSHTSTGATLDTAVGMGPDAFTSSFVAPAPGSGPTELAAREWVAANELRYWANGSRIGCSTTAPCSSRWIWSTPRAWRWPTVRSGRRTWPPTPTVSG
ncbi:MAG: hypothetical protein R2789_00105 [Microthrixaceae bacterium]